MPFYWKRGLAMGLVVGVMLHLLLQQLELRSPVLPMGNVPTQANSRPVHRGTPLGPLLGVTVFVLCCVMPGPSEGRVGG